MNTPNHPDGLTESDVDLMEAEVFTSVTPIRRPTSPFAMYELDVRRERREYNRTLGAQVRALPVSRPALVWGEAA
jgi:hypothetical protein